MPTLKWLAENGTDLEWSENLVRYVSKSLNPHQSNFGRYVAAKRGHRFPTNDEEHAYRLGVKAAGLDGRFQALKAKMRGRVPVIIAYCHGVPDPSGNDTFLGFATTVMKFAGRYPSTPAEVVAFDLGVAGHTLYGAFQRANNDGWLPSEIHPSEVVPVNSVASPTSSEKASIPKPRWTVRVGAQKTRNQLRAKYGGIEHGSIIMSAAPSDDILLFSEPRKGLGHELDGWTEDMERYLFTGDGATGDHTLEGVNLAIASHRRSGKALRLFVTREPVQDSADTTYAYVGRFDVDLERPYARADGIDGDGEARSVIVFRLQPRASTRRGAGGHCVTGDAASSTVVASVSLETYATDSFTVSGSAASIGTRRESALADSFQAALLGRGHTVCRLRIKPAGELSVLLTDIYDETTNTLYEVKSSATREAVRMLVGQLLDYRRHIQKAGLSISAVLPAAPRDDLLDLIHSIGADCVWPTREGAFERSQPPYSK